MGATTRRIALEVGCSEGALYVHFKGRLTLFLAMLENILLDMIGPLSALGEKVGQGTVAGNLRDALAGVYRFQERASPLFAGLFADAKLLSAFRKSLLSTSQGPHLSLGALAGYIREEQNIGRVDGTLDASLAASILLSCCFFRAFNEHFFAKPLEPAWDIYAAHLVSAVLRATPKKG